MNVRANLKSCLVMAMFLIAMGCTAAAGRTIYVDDDGAAEFDNIQAAIDDSNDGDTIIVRDGTYTGGGNRDIDFLGKAITVRSENSPENCIIDCNGTEAEPHRGFYFHNGEDSNSVLDGFTITNGYVSNLSSGQWYLRGGGIYCFEVSPTIRNCIITNNKAEGGRGGGICCRYCPGVLITNCVITENVAALGGGIYSNADAIITNCVITKNFASVGGGIYADGDNFSGDLKITNSTFSANTATWAGAIACGELSSPSLVNCVLWGDIAPHGPEIAMTTLDWGSALSISFSDVQGGQAAIYDIDDLDWGPGNIDIDPLFADAENGDYHLKSQAGRWDPNSESWVTDSNTSPCIDAGNPGCPLGDEPNGVNNIRINMGAFGGTAEASKTPANWRSIADLTNDWVVDFNDLKVFVDHWLETGECIPSDLTRNQSVDFADFAIMAFHWLECTAPECETIVEVSTETDKSTYLLGEVVTVFVTAYNPNPEPVTLYFGSSLVASYFMDGVFDWSEWQVFTPSVLQLTIEPYNSYTWLWPPSHGPYEMTIYPLDVGTHTVVGEVVGYGCSAPVEFEVVAE